MPPAEAAAPQFLYLTTAGRRTGLPREIEIWFVTADGKFYVFADEFQRAQGVKNIAQYDEPADRGGRWSLRIPRVGVTGMRRFSVGQAEAVDELVAKIHGFHGRFAQTPAVRRLEKAINRAYVRHRQVGSPDNRGFYHGLLTGYAVAMKVIEGKLNRPAFPG